MNSNRKAVIAKKIQFMIPKAKLAFSIEQGLLKLTENGPDALAPFEPTYTPKELLVLKLVQFCFAMPRSS